MPETLEELLTDPKALDKLFSKDPTDLTDIECDAIVHEIRKHRADQSVRKAPRKKTSKAPSPTKTQVKLSDAGLDLDSLDLDLGDFTTPKDE